MTFAPYQQKIRFFTGLTSQIWCIKGLVCQAPHIWVTVRERTVSIISAAPARTLCYEMNVLKRNERKERKRQLNEMKKISNKWRLYCIWSKCSLSQKFAQQSYWCEFSLTLCGELPLTLLFERRTCLALLFIYRFEVCPYTMHLSYACVQKNPRTLSHSHFTNTAALFSQQSHSWIATHHCAFYWWRVFFFFSLSLKFWIQAEKGDKRSRVMMGELGSGREEIKLRQWRRGRHSCLAVEICERVNSAQGAPEVTAGGGRGQLTLKQHSWAVKWAKILNATMFQCQQSAKNVSSLRA